MSRVEDLVKQLYTIVDELESLYPGRKFTPDGHLVGSIGECLCQERYGLELKTAGTKGFDAVDAQGRQVEIKCTQGKTIAIRSQPEWCIVVLLSRDGTISEVFNGPGKELWSLTKERQRSASGAYNLRIGRIRALPHGTPADNLKKKR